jgi:hypothetical protein
VRESEMFLLPLPPKNRKLGTPSATPETCSTLCQSAKPPLIYIPFTECRTTTTNGLPALHQAVAASNSPCAAATILEPSVSTRLGHSLPFFSVLVCLWSQPSSCACSLCKLVIVDACSAPPLHAFLTACDGRPSCRTSSCLLRNTGMAWLKLHFCMLTTCSMVCARGRNHTFLPITSCLVRPSRR